MLVYRKPAREMQRMGNYDELYTMKVLRMEMRIWWICRENGMQNKHERTHTHITMTNWIGEHTMPTHYSSNLSFFFVFLSHSSILSLSFARFVLLWFNGAEVVWLSSISFEEKSKMFGSWQAYIPDIAYIHSRSVSPPLSLLLSVNTFALYLNIICWWIKTQFRSFASATMH